MAINAKITLLFVILCSVGLLFNFYFSKYAMKLPCILTQFYKDISM